MRGQSSDLKIEPTDIPEETIALLCNGLGIDSDVMSVHDEVMSSKYAPKDRMKIIKKLLVEEFDRRGIGYRH